MEKNKIDSFEKMTSDMKNVVDFEIRQNQKLFAESPIAVNDKEAYIISRKFWNQDGPEVYRTIEESINGPYGDILFRIYYPNEKPNNKCIIYIHGGGFTVGNIDTHDGIIRRLAQETGAIIIGIDYRLSPEYKFPVPIKECETLVEYIHEYGAKYQIDKGNISLAGDSAGAYLSLAVTLYLRDKRPDISNIKSLLLYYGAYGLKDSMSQRLFGGYWDGLTLEALHGYNKSFTNQEDEDSPYRLLFNSDLTYGIPPSYILACELDPLLDDSKLLHQILRAHGTTTKLEIFNGVIHAFLHYSRMLPQSMEAITRSAEFYNIYTS
ncbi:MAG: alpha/beta hydrolase fold domain-containing protein [Anaerocolumna sp.]